VKFLALIYADEQAWAQASDDERQAVYEGYSALRQAAGDRLVDGAETAASSAATTIRVRDGQTIVTDGPFTELREQLGGFILLECGSEDEALELAKLIPSLDRGAFVVVQPAFEEAA
jgi:hypothetical protein